LWHARVTLLFFDFFKHTQTQNGRFGDLGETKKKRGALWPLADGSQRRGEQKYEGGFF